MAIFFGGPKADMPVPGRESGSCQAVCNVPLSVFAP